MPQVAWAIVFPAAVLVIQDQRQRLVVPNEGLGMEETFRVVTPLRNVVLFAVAGVVSPDGIA
jgi:hypothetical protein